MSQPQRKRLRKSTKSCLECRKRKCKCTYNLNEGNPPCDGCIERRTDCISQHDAFDPSQASMPTRERVDKLEDLVQTLSREVAILRHGSQSSSTSRIANDLILHSSTVAPQNTNIQSSETEWEEDRFTEHDTAHYSSTQLLQSFGHSFVARDEHACEDRSWQARARDRLLYLVPSRDDVLLITASAVDWWSLHNSLLPEPRINNRMALIEEHSRLYETEHPLDVAIWLICLAITCLQLPSDFDYTALDSIPPAKELVSRIVEEIHHVLSVEEAIGTLKGIECAVVFAQLQKFIGRPKRGWLTLRRAISYAELMNLQSSRRALKQLQAQPDPSDLEVELHEYKAKLWDQCCGIDRMLSIILCMPSTARNYNCPPSIDPNARDSETRYSVWRAGVFADRIVARDQMSDGQEAWAETQDIMKQLAQIESEWPADWNTVDFRTTYDLKTSAVVLHQSGHSFIVLRCNLPYLFKAEQDPTTYHINATSCLQSCRIILRHYFALRTRLASGAFLSRTCDIHAFTASIILILHRDQQSSGFMPTTDSALLENAKTAMRSAPTGLGQALTTRMVVALNAVQQCLDGDTAAPEKVRLRVPVLGPVTIWRSEPGNGRLDVNGALRPEFEVGDAGWVSEGGGIAFDFDALDDDWFLQDGC